MSYGEKVGTNQTGDHEKIGVIVAKKYQERLHSLLAQIDIGHDVQVQPFFGGAAAYTNGRIFLSLTKVGFAVKLSAAERQELLQVEGARKLQYFPNAPVKKEYVVLPDYMLKDSHILRQWVVKSISYVTATSDTEQS